MKKTSKSMAGKPSVFTIVTREHLLQALHLLESLIEADASSQRYVVAIDLGPKARTKLSRLAEVIDVEELEGFKEDPWLLQDLKFRFSKIELSRVLKARAAKTLLNRVGVDRLIYLNSDIVVYSALTEAFEALKSAPFILTPHLATKDFPFDDGFAIDENSILNAGCFNLDFFGVSKSKASLEILTWWQSRTEWKCSRVNALGHFEDQKVLNNLPVIFPEVSIVKNLGYNVGYWNLHERPLSTINSKILVAEQPLVFFNFSGYNPQYVLQLSQFQTRFNLHESSLLRQLYINFNRATNPKVNVDEKSIDSARTWDHFENGCLITNFVRETYSNLEAGVRRQFGNPFRTSEEKFKTSFENESICFFNWLIRPDHFGLAPIHLKLREQRQDLREAFKDIESVAAAKKLIEWCAEFAADELKLGAGWKRILIALNGKSASDRQILFQPDDGHRPLGFGINLIGFFDSEKGIGQSTLLLEMALKEAGIPVARVPLYDDRSSTTHKKRAINLPAPFEYNLFHVNPDQMTLQSSIYTFMVNSRYTNIAYWYWELSKVPDTFVKLFAYIDEIWAPTKFIQTAFQEVASCPVYWMPPPLNPAWSQIADKSLKKKKMQILTVFDFDSQMERKNPVGSILAFKKAFPRGDEPVELLLKSSRGHLFPEQSWQFSKEVAKDKRIFWKDEVIAQDKMFELMANADVYLSLHRSEGLGLNLLEAMTRNIPVITTDYSGPNDFVSNRNALITPHEKVTLKSMIGPYPKGAEWSEPDVETAAKHLIDLFECFVKQKPMPLNFELPKEYQLKNSGRRVAERIKFIAGMKKARAYLKRSY